MKATISQKVSSKLKNYNGKVKQSLQDLFIHGTTCTGESGYRKSRSYKDIWTAETIKAAHEIGLTVHSGNSFSKGGAGGEWVKLVEDGRKNKLAQECRKVFKRYLKIRKLRSEKTEIAKNESTGNLQRLTVLALSSRKTEIEAWQHFKRNNLRTLIKSL
jgi:hypothetical protein